MKLSSSVIWSNVNTAAMMKHHGIQFVAVYQKPYQQYDTCEIFLDFVMSTHSQYITYRRTYFIQKHIFSSRQSIFFIILVLLDQINKIKFTKNSDTWQGIEPTTCLAVWHPSHCTRMFSMLVLDYNWLLLMYRWFC